MFSVVDYMNAKYSLGWILLANCVTGQLVLIRKWAEDQEPGSHHVIMMLTMHLLKLGFNFFRAHLSLEGEN
jgi:hypothetical protein